MRKHEGERKQIKTPERIVRERGRKANYAIIIIVLLIGIGFMGFRLYKHHLVSKILPEVTIEAGSPIDVTLFTQGNISNGVFVTDISGIDTTVPASYGLKVSAGDRIKVMRDVVLNIVDTTAPTAEAVPQTIYTDGLPAPEDTVTNIYDLSACTVSYAQQMPEILEGGSYDVPVKITDAYGNETIINVPAYVAFFQHFHACHK